MFLLLLLLHRLTLILPPTPLPPKRKIGKIAVFFHLPCEQRFLSCMAFSVYEVIRVAWLSRSWFVYERNGLQQRILTGREQTNYATDKPREWLRKHW